MAGRYQNQPFMAQQSGQQFQSQGQQWQAPETVQSSPSSPSQRLENEEKELKEAKPKILKYKVCGMPEKLAWKVFWGLLAISAAFALAAILVNSSQSSDSSDEAQRKAAPSMREVDLPQSSVVASAAALNSACSVNPSMYHQSEECLTSLSFWQDTSKFSEMAGGCFIDPNTGVMNCTSRDSCGGGILRPGQKLGKQFVYPCADKCSNDAALFSSCCNVCQTQQKLELADGQYGVECQGCNESYVTKMPAPDCTFENGTFKCAVEAECQAGEPLSFATPQSCNVLPCDECSDGIMRSTCCAKCLQHKCAFGSSTRMVCQGCDLPTSTTSQVLLVADRSVNDATENRGSPLAWWLGLSSIIALVVALILLVLLCLKPKEGITTSRRGSALESESRESSEQGPLLSTKWRSTIVGPSGEVLEATTWNEGEPPEQVNNVVHVPHSLQPPVSSLAASPSTSTLQAQQPFMPPTSMFQQQAQPPPVMGQQTYMQYTSGQMAYAPQASGQQPYMTQAFVQQQPQMRY